MIDRFLGAAVWRPSPSYLRFQREARRRAARTRRTERFAAARAFLSRNATEALLATLLVVYAIGYPTVSAIVAQQRAARAAAEQARADAAAYRALALHLVHPGNGRLLVRLDAQGPDELLSLLDSMRATIEAQRGEVRP